VSSGQPRAPLSREIGTIRNKLLLQLSGD